MASRKQKLQKLRELKGDWSASHISINYKKGIKNDLRVHNSIDAFNIADSVWNRDLINLHEQFVALYFSASKQLIGWRVISSGNMQAVAVHMKLIVSLALQSMASGVIIAHNIHPVIFFRVGAMKLLLRG